MRTVLLILLVAAVGAVYVRAHAASEDASAIAASPAQSDGLPRDFYGWMPDPTALLHSAEALPGLGAIFGDHADAPPRARAFPFADIGAPRQIAAVRRAIRRNLDAINALSDATPGAAARTLADVYSARVLAALGPGGRRAFAARVAGTTRVARHVRVLGYAGVMVSGSRALAEVVYRVSVRAPSGHFLVRRPSTWTVTLVRERGRWRFVRGFDTA